MKQILHDNAFMTISLLEDGTSLDVEVKKGSEDYTDEAYREDQFVIFNCIKTYKPRTIQVDLRALAFTVTPELQVWTAQHVIAPAADFGLQRIAHIMPEDFIANLAIEQLEQEVQGTSNSIEICIFKNKEEALPWLNVARQNAA